MDPKLIILCVTGSISASSTPRLLKLLLPKYKVFLILSKGALQFINYANTCTEIGPDLLKNLVYFEWNEFGILEMKKLKEISEKASLLVAIPLSANSLGKLFLSDINDPIVFFL